MTKCLTNEMAKALTPKIVEHKIKNIQKGVKAMTTTKTVKHSPTPWTGYNGVVRDATGEIVTENYDIAFIVEAVNSHEAVNKTLADAYTLYGDYTEARKALRMIEAALNLGGEE